MKTYHGKPIPIRDLARETLPPSPVVTYQLSPEELEKYRNPGKNHKSSEKVTDVSSFPFTRDQYIAERLGGKSRADIAKEQGVTAAGLVYHLSK